MVKYNKMGYSSLDEFSNNFLDTLLESNHTYEFYVNWDKVYDNLKKHLVEISILNSLNKVQPEKLEIEFRKIINDYTEVVPLLPLILAIRNKKVPVFNIQSKSSKIINFSKKGFNTDEIVEFSLKTGLLNLFNNIDDLYSYLVGTEVGLDTNARKNRSGHIFEDAVGTLLQEKITNREGFNIVKEDINVDIERNKRFDYVIYKNNVPRIVFECNFYNSTGSKPIEVAHAYANLQEDIDKTNLIFIWVTDGFGWKKMISSLLNAGENIDYILNYQMLNKLLDDFLDNL
ncbi:DpnII family type II restriction endonuclease [uncultured Methanobrevibacter sp.]|uniref:DpnII family type II restriction endonuclease n=1 Tax=uncultured Methanobrevibacter sp. TaxID=253161 RepID=UPI0025F19420|nr:DpnII family type II restriction endonuclease [uncultured Methanobrevibacter sp.]